VPPALDPERSPSDAGASSVETAPQAAPMKINNGRGHQQSRRTPPCHTDAASLLPATRLGAVEPIMIKRPDQTHQSSRESDLSAAQVSLKSASPRACKCASAQPYLVTHVGLWCADCGCNERSCRRRPWELDDEGCTREASSHRIRWSFQL
jgi:hypothetical protein